jgi:hypothetical protein
MSGIGKTPLVSITNAVKQKIKDHYGKSSEMGLKLCIFAMETLGSRQIFIFPFFLFS